MTEKIEDVMDWVKELPYLACATYHAIPAVLLFAKKEVKGISWKEFHRLMYHVYAVADACNVEAQEIWDTLDNSWKTHHKNEESEA